VFHAAAELSGHHHAFSFVDIILMLISLALALAGWGLAYSAYVQKPQLPAQWAERWQTLYTWSIHKYYVDEGYDQAVVRPMHRLAVGLWQIFDVKVIDLIVNGVARAVALVGDVMQPVQTGYVRTYALWVAIGALCILWFIV
jgi:NADH-quinone oxidoreductase subunit L